MDPSIITYLSRYMVPFYYNYEKDGYETIRDYFLAHPSYDESLYLPKDGQWVTAGFWENYKSGKQTQAEMDLYSYLPTMFLEENDLHGKDVSNLGISFVYKTNGKLFDLQYQYHEKEHHICCNGLGILLFRNGLGFIWYEVDLGKNVPVEVYVEFQRDFKELARTHRKTFLWKKEYCKEQKKYIYEDFCLGKWLSQILSAEELGIRFWAERETKLANGHRVRIPDKSLLYQYLFLDQVTSAERNNLIFHIANGYDNKYCPPENLDESLYKPFNNTCFYISKAGMACIAVNDIYSNEEFFKAQFKEKYNRDYFFIYILLSYQSYSCAHYSRLFTKLPANENLFSKKKRFVKKLESFNGQINLFLVKSIFESVSNVHHQNGVYRYGKKELSIEEDLRSLTVGLDSLKALEREKQERNVNQVATFFSIIITISVLFDGLNLIDFVIKKGSEMLKLGYLIIIAIIVIPAVYFLVKLIKNLLREV